jgi:hypothetical protein
MSTARKLFKRAAAFLGLIDHIVSTTSNYEYSFVSDDWFKQWTKSADFKIEQMNFIVALELLEKAHLASLTALLRAKRWADATCLMYEKATLLGWSASFRGLLEILSHCLNSPPRTRLGSRDSSWPVSCTRPIQPSGWDARGRLVSRPSTA